MNSASSLTLVFEASISFQDFILIFVALLRLRIQSNKEIAETIFRQYLFQFLGTVLSRIHPLAHHWSADKSGEHIIDTEMELNDGILTVYFGLVAWQRSIVTRKKPLQCWIVWIWIRTSRATRSWRASSVSKKPTTTDDFPGGRTQSPRYGPSSTSPILPIQQRSVSVLTLNFGLHSRKQSVLISTENLHPVLEYQLKVEAHVSDCQVDLPSPPPPENKVEIDEFTIIFRWMVPVTHRDHFQCCDEYWKWKDAWVSYAESKRNGEENDIFTDQICHHPLKSLQGQYARRHCTPASQYRVITSPFYYYFSFFSWMLIYFLLYIGIYGGEMLLHILSTHTRIHTDTPPVDSINMQHRTRQ